MPAVPVYWVYVTGWGAPDGVTQFRDDIYQRDGLGVVDAATMAPASGSQTTQQTGSNGLLHNEENEN